MRYRIPAAAALAALAALAAGGSIDALRWSDAAHDVETPLTLLPGSIATPDVASRLKPMLARRGAAGARVRLVMPVAEGEEAILALPEDYLLASGQRLDVEGIPGVLAVQDLARLH